MGTVILVVTLVLIVVIGSSFGPPSDPDGYI